MDRLLQNAGGKIRVFVFNDDGNLTDADPATSVTAAVLDPTGTAIAGSPFVSTNEGTGTYRVSVPGAAAGKLGEHAATWGATLGGDAKTFAGVYEVVGGFLFSPGELRALDPSLADEGKYSIEDLNAAREDAEERFEGLMGASLRRRGRQVTLDGTGDRQIILPDMFPSRIVSASIGGVALSAGDLADIDFYDEGVASRDQTGVWTAGRRNVVIYYEYGLRQAPEPWRKACLALAKERLVNPATFKRSETISTDQGVLRQSIAGRDGPTGLPEVDAIIKEFSYRIPGVA